jgi:hypothetical protein
VAKVLVDWWLDFFFLDGDVFADDDFFDDGFAASPGLVDVFLGAEG